MNYFKSPAKTGLFLFLGLTFSAAFTAVLPGCTSSYQKMANKPVEKVNDHVLTAKDFADQLARSLRNYDALAAKDPANIFRIKNDILRQFLEKSLTLDWAQANNVTIADSVLDKEVDKLRASYPDDLSFRRSLALENLSFSEWREELRYVLIQRELFKKIDQKIKAPTDEDVHHYYDENRDHYKRKERIQIRQILVDSDTKADIIRQDLKTKDFATLAKKYSIAPEASNGGLVGWIEKGTVDFFDPLFTNSSGIQTIKSPFGVHIVKVEKKAPASNLSLEDVKTQIVQALRAQREQAEYTAWLDAQLRSSKVLKDVDLMNSITVDTRGKND